MNSLSLSLSLSLSHSLSLSLSLSLSHSLSHTHTHTHTHTLTHSHTCSRSQGPLINAYWYSPHHFAWLWLASRLWKRREPVWICIFVSSDQAGRHFVARRSRSWFTVCSVFPWCDMNVSERNVTCPRGYRASIYLTRVLKALANLPSLPLFPDYKVYELLTCWVRAFARVSGLPVLFSALTISRFSVRMYVSRSQRAIRQRKLIYHPVSVLPPLPIAYTRRPQNERCPA